MSGIPAIRPHEKTADAPAPPQEPAPIQAPQEEQRTSEQTNVRPKERTKTRHSFDVFEDQLLSLKEIQLQREKESGEKTLLGDLVQEALDRLIAEERTKGATT